MNKKISLFILIILTLSLFGSDPKPIHAQTWWNTGWSYRIIIEIDHTKIDYDLTNFPVLVHLNSSRINWTHVQDNLDDLRFVDEDGITQLYAELENYTVNNEAWIWVKIPEINSIIVFGINQLFYLYYGNNAVSSWWNPEDVWEDSAVMVQHMRDNPDNAHIMDSTQYDNDGAKKGANKPVEISGKIDSAQSFDGVNDIITITAATSLNIQTTQTIIGWIKLNALPNSLKSQMLVFKTACYGFRFNYVGQIGYFVWAKSEWDSATTPITTAWHHICWTYDGAAHKIYVDGVNVLNYAVIETFPVLNNDMRLGTDGGLLGYEFFEGIQEEVRIYKRALSAAEVKADYNSGADTLLIYGVEELCPLALIILYNTGINKLYINGTERANNTTIFIDKNTNVNATVTLKPNFIFMKYALGSMGASLIPTYIFNMTNPFTLWSYATPNFFIYEEPTTLTFTHWLILLFIALIISLLAAIKFHIIATVSFILVLYMIINVASYNGIILLAIIIWLLTIMFSIIAFLEI